MLWLPVSKRGFSLSRIEGLHRLAFSKRHQLPSQTALSKTESTHSNLETPLTMLLWAWLRMLWSFEVAWFCWTYPNFWRNLWHYSICSDWLRSFFLRELSRLRMRLVSSRLEKPCLSDWSSLRNSERSPWEVYSKQPKSWAVSLFSLSRILLSPCPLIFDMVYRFSKNLSGLFVTTKRDKLAFRQSVMYCSCLEC